MYLMSFASGLVRYRHIQNPEAAFPLLGKFANISWHLLPVFLVIFIVFLILNAWNFTKSKKIEINEISFYIVGFLAIITFFLSNYLLGLELSNYNNFLYASYGITKTSVYWLSNTSLITIIMFGGFIYFDRKRLLKKRSLSNQRMSAILALGILVWYSLLTFVKASDLIWYAKFTHDKMFENYTNIVELKNNVPEDGVVILPPQSSIWPDISNAPIVRYFIFPRTIVSASYLTNQEMASDFDEIYFVGLHNNTNTWPVIDKKRRVINFGVSDLQYSDLKVESGSEETGVYKIIFKK